MWTPPVFTAYRIARGLFQAYQFARDEGWLDRAREVLTRRQRILVLGRPGVGKSQLIATLRRDMAESLRRLLAETPDAGALRIDPSMFDFVELDYPDAADIDGQAVSRALSNGPSGILNVVAFGYHEHEHWRAEALTPEGMADPRFLARCRDAELASTASLFNALRGADLKGSWMLTVVTKADLWWDNAQSVFDHYVRGPYRERLGIPADVPMLVLPHASVFMKFFGSGPLCGQFDERDRRDCLANLLKALIHTIGEKPAPALKD